jgi:hypothetical protein
MIEGKREFDRNLDKWSDRGWGAAKQAMLDGANDIISKSVKECPVDTGTLRRSHTVEEVKDGADEYTVAMGYNTDYAIYVHENLQATHSKGKAKFLEDPVNANMDNLEKRIAKAIQGVKI